jgi:two-component system response regulator LytT
MKTQINNPNFSSTQKAMALTSIFKENEQYKFDELAVQLAAMAGKRSFLVFKQNKYVAIPVENIAFFHSRNAAFNLVCMDQRRYPVNHSLDQIQQLLTGKQFFRINRQYLINFNAIKEVEHYFARKLLVNLTISTEDKLLVPKERARHFMEWMENG